MIATLQQELQQKYSWIKELHMLPEGGHVPTSDDPPQEAEGPLPASMRLQIVVSSYKVKDNSKLLADIGQWAEANEVDVAPFVLTEREALQFAAIGAPDAPTPQALLRHHRSIGAPLKASRQQVERALSEIRRMLRALEQEFPTSGLHAWNVGLRLEVLFQQSVAWAWAILESEEQQEEQGWEALLKGLHPYNASLNSAEMRHYPLQLEAFLQRHQKLASLMPSSYGDNDLELAQLVLPLEQLLQAIQKLANERLMTPEEAGQRTQVLWWITMLGSISLIIGLAALALVSRPPAAGAVSLPKGAKPGGIIGVYYKGRKFESFRSKRLDRRLWFRWPTSPIRGVPGDQFSIRWKGFLKADITGKHKICLRYDDAARMWLGPKQLVKDWRGGPVRTRCQEIHLQKGWHPLKIEMFEFNGPASLKLSWSTPLHKKVKPVPSPALCCKR